jgi:hypothetical protein
VVCIWVNAIVGLSPEIGDALFWTFMILFLVTGSIVFFGSMVWHDENYMKSFEERAECGN